MHPGLIRALLILSGLVAIGVITSVLMLRQARTSESKGAYFRIVIMVWLVINLLLLLLVLLIR
jgi:hypothetical protein